MESIPRQQFSSFIRKQSTSLEISEEGSSGMCSQPPFPLPTNQDSSHLSDCESGTSLDDTKEIEPPFPGTGFTRVDSREALYKAVGLKLMSGLSVCSYDAEIEAMYRNNFSTVMSEARLQSFQIYLKAMNTKHGGSANEVYAWYGASSTAEARAIILNGFSSPDAREKGIYGQGIYLSPTEKPLNSLLSATPEADGRRCMLLCRVILGRPELVCPGSRQYHPCSGEFDSGVDSLSSPATYVVWSSHMNTHILPEMLVIFKASRTPYRIEGSKRVPTTAWVPFSALIGALSEVLPGDAIELIGRVHGEYKKQKMSRMEMVRRVRDIAGDRLLLEIIKSYRRRRSTPSPSPLARR